MTGAPDAILWLDDRLNGKPVAGGCSQSDVITSLSDPNALLTLGETLWQILLDLIGEPIGPESIT